MPRPPTKSPKSKRRGRRPRHICIYLITCIRNGRVYVGSSKDTCMRWNSHLWDLINWKHCNKELLVDWHKYGYQSFTFQILEILEDDTQLRSIEQEWINKYKKYKSSPYNKINANNRRKTDRKSNSSSNPKKQK